MRATAKSEDMIKSILPWASSDYLEKAISERKREIVEVLGIIDSLTLSEIPDEVKGIVKRPRWETFLVE
ncbi:hypothetical protein [Thermococcus gorgonarius]|uniref:Uncharacterized protein n=1 Tax=Thermococcus gorgonarius TaxID=71997 RepID=A0A2Z2M4B7_THEGO|nr:hypothetical protein [Thermococcus gorgonarius]ASJ00760.1 hypothetical protein A3K92_04325 [Thermococcus gorgonarius]